MKFLYKTLIILILVYFSLRFLVFFFDSKHDVNYSVGNFNIKEEFKAKDNNYYFKISQGDFNLNFQVNENFNKAERVVTNILYKEIDGYQCVFPIFKKNKVLTDIMCLKDNVITYAYDLGSLTNDFQKELKKVKLNISNDKLLSVTVDMGGPILDTKLIPINSNKNKINLNILDKNFTFTCVSMGNPHAVTFVDDVDNFDVEKYGKLIEINDIFPNKTNVEFAQIIDKNHIKMRVWERGAGETLACGTGASATAVAAILNNLTNSEVEIELKGGHLNLKWDNHVYMTGPAEITFEGEFYD